MKGVDGVEGGGEEEEERRVATHTLQGSKGKW